MNGAASFQYTLSDGALADTATVTLDIAAVEDVPIADDLAVSGAEDTLIPGQVLAVDGDGDDLTFTLDPADQPENGVVTVSPDGSFSYDPNGDFNGTDSFTVIASDGDNSDTAVVTVTVTPVNDAPVAADVDASVGENGPAFTITADVVDPDQDDTLSFELDLSGTTGLVTNNGDGTFNYDPNGLFESLGTDETAQDMFTYTVTDSAGEEDTATVMVTINGVDDAPVGIEDAYVTEFRETLTVPAAEGLLSNDSDVEGNTLANAVVVDDVDNGTLTVNSDGSFTYIPNSDFSGDETFTYTVDANGLTSAETTVTITVGDAIQPGDGDSVLTDADDRLTTNDAGVNRVIGGEGGDVISTGGGDDILVGGAGDDNLLGGADNDILIGGAGGDEFTGGTGTDRFVITGADFDDPSLDTIFDFELGIDVLEISGFGTNDVSSLNIIVAGGPIGLLSPTGAGGVLFDNLTIDDIAALRASIEIVEEATSFAFSDPVSEQNLPDGNSNFATLDNGANTITGGDGANFINGAGGADVIDGGAGGDIMNGEAGDDRLLGGAGNDNLTGGAGSDTFVFNFSDSTGSLSVDTINDYVAGEDGIEINGYAGVDDFGDLTTGVVATFAAVFIDGTSLADANNVILFSNLTDPAQLDQNDFTFG